MLYLTENMSKSALKNKKKREAKQKAKAEVRLGPLWLKQINFSPA